MSRTIDVRDAILEKISTTLGNTYFRLMDPLAVDRNNGLYYAKGYGVAFGPGVNPNLTNGCEVSWQRLFNVLLSKEYATTDHNETLKDELEATLMEDFVTLIKAFSADPTLEGVCAKIEYVADSGIEQNRIDAKRYIELSFDLQATYTEPLP